MTTADTLCNGRVSTSGRMGMKTVYCFFRAGEIYTILEKRNSEKTEPFFVIATNFNETSITSYVCLTYWQLLFSLIIVVKSLWDVVKIHNKKIKFLRIFFLEKNDFPLQLRELWQQ